MAYLKVMRYTILGLLLFFTVTLFGQKKTQIEFQVRGVCGMCESRIVKALDVPGVIMAEWDRETEKAKVAFKTSVISEEQIHQRLANVGHDTDKVTASDEAYANLHSCCKYRESEGGCSGAENDKHHPE